MKIFAYISGNLAAETMGLILPYIEARGHQIGKFTDGYLPEILEDIQLTPEKIPMEEAFLENQLKGFDFVLSSIRSPGTEERTLIRTARKLGIPCLVVLADIGTGAQKFKDSMGWALPNLITVSDKITHQALLTGGIPSEIIFSLGSVYIDSIAAKKIQLKPALRNKIGYFAVPNLLDFKTWGTQNYYLESDVMEMISEAIKDLDVSLTIRLHPKEYHVHPYTQFIGPKIHIEPLTNRPSLEDFIANHGIFLSTYSTAILISRFLGRPSISTQPRKGPFIRKDLYEAYSIPLVTNSKDLKETLVTFLAYDQKRAPLDFLYNKGAALSLLPDAIEQARANVYE